jgi:hypothetical protein
MNWLKFISEMTASLAWPVAAVIIVCVFRRGILQRLPNLSRLSLPGGISAEFTKELESVEAAVIADAEGNPALTSSTPAAGEVEPALTQESVKISAPEERLGNLSARYVEPPKEIGSDNFVLFLKPTVTRTVREKISLQANPTGVVMESWKVLESSLRDLASSTFPPNVTLSRKMGILQIFDVLNRRGVATAAEIDTLRRMLAMRNLAAHGDEPISDDSAKRFQEIAESLANVYRARADARSLLPSGSDASQDSSKTMPEHAPA